MALNIKNPDVERLAAEVAALAHESMTQAVLQALRAYKAALLRQRDRQRRLADVHSFLQSEVWDQPHASAALSDDELLGYGPSGA